MPRWVPVAIGVILVALAGLAVITGLRYRDSTLVKMVSGDNGPRTTTSSAPPGEPEAGASLVVPGEDGQNVPSANEPVSGDARAVVSGGPGGVTATVRTWARRAVVFEIEPSEAMVYVNDMPIGEARQFDSMDEAYELPHAGSYTIRVVAEGHRERQFIVTAADDAQQDVARLRVTLEKQ
ncbi:MAG TPA: hypothetical protein VF111_06150 [Thermoanaerobaculia bacterium]